MVEALRAVSANPQRPLEFSVLRISAVLVGLALSAVWSLGFGATTDTASGKRPSRFLELKLFPNATPRPAPTATPKPAPTPTPPPKAAPKPTPQATRTPAATKSPAPPNQAQKEFDLAVSYIKRGRIAEAKTILNALVHKYPKSDLSPHALIQIAEIEDSLPIADKTLQRVIQEYPKSEWVEVAYYKRGEVNMLSWNYRTALEMFDQYLKRNPTARQTAVIRRQMAACRLKLGEPDKALADLELLCREKPEVANQPETLETLAECQIELGHTDKALDALQTLVKKHPTYPSFSRAFLLFALCLEDQNRFPDAIGAYGNLIEQFPRSPEAGLAKMRLADLRQPLTLQPLGVERSTTATAAAVRLTTPSAATPRPTTTTMPAVGPAVPMTPVIRPTTPTLAIPP
jgi:TolA-binding protein